MNGLRILALLGALALGAASGGCDKSAESSPGPVSASTEPTQAQPKLRTMKLWIGPEEINAELALTPQQVRTGMMFRTNTLPEDAGMLFPLPYTQRASFWMKNCPVPLSAAYIDPNGVIQEIHTLEANNTNAVDATSDNIRFVLETSQGWFERHHIGVGTSVSTEHGNLMDTFFGVGKPEL
jgi:uncharacterized protein